MVDVLRATHPDVCWFTFRIGLLLWCFYAGFAAYQTRIWTTALTEFVLRAEAMLIVNARDGARSMYYTANYRFDHVFGGLLFQLSAMILDTVVNFGLYGFAIRIGTDPKLTALAVERCM